MYAIEEIDHTADIGLRICASSLPELFRAAAEGMFNLILDPDLHSPATETKAVHLRSDSPENLLREWLAELLYLHATRKMVFARFDIESVSGTALEATALGFRMSDEQTAAATEIKAVTYHALTLKETAEGFEAQVIFDT